MSQFNSQVVIARPPPPHSPWDVTTAGSQTAIVLPATRPNQRYLDDERSVRAPRDSGSGSGSGSTGRSKHGRRSSQTRISPKRTSHNMQGGLDNRESIIMAEYKDIEVRGSGVNINGSIGVPQAGKWCGIKANLEGGALHNGGINKATSEDVEVVKALMSSSKPGHKSKREKDPGCCAVM